MTDQRFDFATLHALLRRPENDPAVAHVLSGGISTIEENYRFVEHRADGIDVTFKGIATGSGELLLSSFHLYSEGYDGFARYGLTLPGSLAFGDGLDTVLAKLGEPVRTGGGDYSSLLKRVTPRWLVFPLGADHLHVQFDGGDHVDLVTLQVPRPAA